MADIMFPYYLLHDYSRGKMLSIKSPANISNSHRSNMKFMLYMFDKDLNKVRMIK